MESELECYPCPYTGRTCYVWDCADCKVEKEEREFMEMLEEEEVEAWNRRAEK